MMKHSSVHDWTEAVWRPSTFRVANSSLRVQTRFVAFVAGSGVLVLIVLYALLPSRGYHSPSNTVRYDDDHLHHFQKPLGLYWNIKSSDSYNSTYPLSVPDVTEFGVRYRIGVITDLDSASKVDSKPTKWTSYLKKGFLTFDIARKYASIQWDKDIITLESTLAQGGRGMELSELVVFNGKLYTVDDRTGVIYEISENQTIPWVILTDGNGRIGKGFKCEWATVKDQKLYVGGLGKEWTTAKGKVLNYNPQWIKVISPNGEVEHLSWRHRYQALLKAAQIDYPGYMIHEAAAWSGMHRQWFFLPRRASKSTYNEKDDEWRGTNYLLRANEDFSLINVNHIGKINPTRGFSSLKFIPETSDTWIIALKSEEVEGKISSYITVFTVTGEMLLAEHKIGDYKYEGIEFI